MEDLCVQEWEQVQVRGVSLELVSYVKVQPHSASFYYAAGSSGQDVQELLTASLSRFSGLTEDTCVPVMIEDETHMMQVVELRPRAAVRIIDSDVEQHFEFQVDFEPAPDLDDEAAVKARQDRLLSEHRARQERQEAQRRAVDEQRESARQQCHAKALERAQIAAGDDDGRSGDVQVSLKLPDGGQVAGKFRVGAPIVALEALALSSDWARACAPAGVQLRERLPPRLLRESDVISKEMHRAAIIVQEQVLDSDVADARSDNNEAMSSLEEEDQDDTNPVSVEPPSPPLLQRNISEVQRRTLEAFEAQNFMRMGMCPEEASRRARNGEVAPPPIFSEKAALSGSSRSSGHTSQTVMRTPSEQERRDRQVEELMAIANVPRSEALEALNSNGWNVQRAVNAVFDAFMSD